MIKLFITFIVQIFLLGFFFLHNSIGASITPEFNERMSKLSSDKEVRVLIFMKEQANLSSMNNKPIKYRKTNAPKVISTIKFNAFKSQLDLVGFLDKEKSKGRVKKYEQFWGVNLISITMAKSVVEELLKRNDIEMIYEDKTILPPSPPLFTQQVVVTSNDFTWGLDRINAKGVWDNFNVNGTGIVIGSIDTGVDITHPDLANKMANIGNGDKGWYDANAGELAPVDINGHGTHTIGTMVGGNANASGVHIGVAPGSKFYSARVFGPNTTDRSMFIKAAQWMMDPDGDSNTNDFPDVINNSWSGDDPGRIDEWFRTIVQNWVALGIVPVFAAGNKFGWEEISNTYISHVSDPGNYPESFCVGATYNTTDDKDEIASFSRRGPATYDEVSYIKPDVSAPGVNVISALAKGTNMYNDNLHFIGSDLYWSDGTSMAAPHVTGTVALMLSVNPLLTVEKVKTILEETAVDLGLPGKDNDYGAGRIDASAAVARAKELLPALPLETPYFLSTDPTSGVTNTAYSFPVASHDPNENSIKFEFNWADGSMSSTAYGNGTNGNVTLSDNHTWTQEGIFGIRVRAVDTDGMFSNWSAPWSMMIKLKPGWGSDNPISPAMTEPPLTESSLISQFPDISSDNAGNVHAVWFGKYDTNGAIYYRKSANEGNNWNNAFIITNVTGNDNHFPVVEAARLNKLQVLWDDLRAPGNWEIYRLESADQGTSWNYPAENFSTTPGNSQAPQLAINGQNIHAVWREGNEIYYKRSAAAGSSWTNPEVIYTAATNLNIYSKPNIVCDATNNVFMVWACQMGNVAATAKYVYFSYSTDNGQTWQTAQQLYFYSGSAIFALNPDLALDANGNIHIVYETSGKEIWYQQGYWSNGNMILTGATVVENNYANSEYPDLVADRLNNLYLFWNDTRDGNYEIYYKFNKAADNIWSADTRITTAAGNSWYPKASVSGGYLHLVWQDNRAGNDRIYYNRLRLRGAPWVTQVAAPDFDVPPYDEAGPPYVDTIPDQTSISFKIQDDTYNQQKISVWIYKADGSAVIKKLVTDQLVTLDNSSDPDWPFARYFQDFVTWDGKDENGNVVSIGTTGRVKISARAVGDLTIDPSDGLPGLIGTNWANIDTTDRDYTFADPTFVQQNRKNLKAWREFLLK